MILPALTGLSLLVLTAAPASDLGVSTLRLNDSQKTAAVQPSVSRATECIAQAVASDPRAGGLVDGINIGDLIVDSMPACAATVRTMIETYDEYFGDGTGEAFFSGPYLDVLPTAVSRLVRERPR